MKLKIIFTTLCLLLSLTTQVFAGVGSGVATVLQMKGRVIAKLVDGSQMIVKSDQELPEGAELITLEKSFARLIFIDKSTINLGPNSSMLIQAFPKKEAGIIKLIRGQIRAEVTKNYMEMEDKSKSKLYIQTKTAAMGIRGTDFQVNYNPVNQNSSLIVFEGKVVMAHIDRAVQNEAFVQQRLENLVSSNTAVFVTQGQISAVNLSVSDRALIPTKLAPKQLDALKENKTGLEEDVKSKKQFRDIVPPGGVDSAAFLNKSSDVAGTDVDSAKGFFNEKTHEYKPRAGAILDLKTVNIVDPPPESKFDHTTKTFVVSEKFGKIDIKTGEFRAPKGFELSNEGKFLPVVEVPATVAIAQPVIMSESNTTTTTTVVSEPVAVATAPVALVEPTATVAPATTTTYVAPEPIAAPVTTATYTVAETYIAPTTTTAIAPVVETYVAPTTATTTTTLTDTTLATQIMTATAAVYDAYTAPTTYTMPTTYTAPTYTMPTTDFTYTAPTTTDYNLNTSSTGTISNTIPESGFYLQK